MICDCAGVLFGDGSHDADCAALAVQSAADPTASEVEQSEWVNLPISDDRVLAALRKLIEYQTTPWDCRCPDYQYRRRSLLTSCKHMRLFVDLAPHLEEIKIMPIQGVTQGRQRMLPREGKIKLGFMKKHSNGNEYPVKTEYFVCPPEVRAVYGDEPKVLTVMFPTLDLDVIAPAWYKAYLQSRSWVCKGDGRLAQRKMNPERVNSTEQGTPWGPLPHRDDKTIELFPGVRCLGRECPDYMAGRCSEVMNLQFLMPDVDSYGVYQIDTGSFFSITSFYDSVDYLQMMGELAGVNYAGVPLELHLVPQDVFPGGRKTTVYILKLRKAGKLEDMLLAGRQSVFALAEGVMPEPDEEADDLLHTGQYAPEGVVPLPDDNDYSNAANFRRAQAGTPSRHVPDMPPHDDDTGEIYDAPPPEKGRGFEQALAECESPADYSAMLRKVYADFDPSEQKVEWMDQITAAAEAAGYVTDRSDLSYSEPEVREVPPAGAEDQETETQAEAEPTQAAAAPPEDPEATQPKSTAPDPGLDEEDQGDDEQPKVICAGPCGEEAELAQVDADGVCSLCRRAAAPPAAQEPQAQEPQAMEPLPF